jgi:hypothetical protein
MKYLLFICTDGHTTPEAQEVLAAKTGNWVDDVNGRGVRLVGSALEGPGSALTVRVRDGETLITDGPFTESKEWVAGFDLIECGDLDEAIEVAATHPMSWFHSIEVRPLDGDRLLEPPLLKDQSQMKFMLMVIGSDQPYTEAEAAAFEAGLPALVAEHKRRNSWLFGHRLQGPQSATTVRVRDGETLISDGPFAESKEFVAGFDVLSCETRDEALELALIHPVSALRAVEVRPIWEL